MSLKNKKVKSSSRLTIRMCGSERTSIRAIRRPTRLKDPSLMVVIIHPVDCNLRLINQRLIYWLDWIESWTGSSSASSSSERLSVKTDDMEATHRGLHKFTPRHADEIEIDIGDPVSVESEADDCWCEGWSCKLFHLNYTRPGFFFLLFFLV